jgi:nucleosome binding factor SPN SPT16 subunit
MQQHLLRLHSLLIPLYGYLDFEYHLSTDEQLDISHIFGNIKNAFMNICEQVLILTLHFHVFEEILNF